MDPRVLEKPSDRCLCLLQSTVASGWLFLKHYFVQTVSACVQLPSMLLQIIIISASLVAQVVKNLPAMQEAGVGSLSREDPPEKGKPPTPVFLPEEFQGQRILAGSSPWVRRVGHYWVTNTLSPHCTLRPFPSPPQAFCSPLVCMCNALCKLCFRNLSSACPSSPLSLHLRLHGLLHGWNTYCHSHTCRPLRHPLQRNFNSLRSGIACASLKHSSHPWYSTSYILRRMNIFT